MEKEKGGEAEADTISREQKSLFEDDLDNYDSINLLFGTPCTLKPPEILVCRYLVDRTHSPASYTCYIICRTLSSHNKTQLNFGMDAETQKLVSLAARDVRAYEGNKSLQGRLDRSIQYARAAVQASGSSQVLPLLILATCLRHRLVKSFSLEVFDEAVETAKDALHIAEENRTPSGWDRRDYLHLLSLLFELYHLKFENDRELSDVDQSIQYLQRRINTRDADDPENLLDLVCLTKIRADKYEVSGLLNDGLSGVQSARRAEELARDKGLDNESEAAAAMGNILFKFCQAGALIDGNDQLDTAIRKMQSAIEGSPTNSHIMRWKHNLASLLEIQFERTGTMEALNEAIVQAEDTVNSPALDDQQRARQLGTLGNLLGRKFEATGESSYLDESIVQLQKGVSLSSHLPNWQQARWPSNLSFALAMRYKRHRRKDDLHNARLNSERACNEGRGHSDRALYIRMHSSNLLLLYEDENKREHLDEALTYGKEAWSLVANEPNNPLWQACADTLAHIHLQRFRRLGELNDSQQAFDLFIRINNNTSQMNPDKAVILHSLGVLYLNELEKRDEDKALDHFLQAFEVPQGQMHVRLKAAQIAMEILRFQQAWQRARQIGTDALRLLPEICERSLTLDDQQYAVLSASGLAADLCSLYLQDDRPTEALQKLEFGRGLILRYMMDRQSNTPALERDCPELAKEYKDLQRLLSHVQPPQDHARLQQYTRMRIEAGEKLKDVIQKIRQREGYESFLLEPTADELTRCTADGVVVIVNVTLIRADAIIVANNRIRSIRLPGLERDTNHWYVYGDYHKYRSFARDMPEKVRDVPSESTDEDSDIILEMLWESCVKPILDELSPQHESPLEETPRVWWIGTGLASILPFHAAGRHHLGSNENALERTISSYIPSINALSFARSLSRSRDPGNGGHMPLLIVAMPETPGQKTLSGVPAECHAIESICHHAYACETLKHPTADQVCDKLAKANIVHFACHGYANETDPSQSYLLLQKDNTPDRLAVSRISRTISNKSAWVAYLSACSTAQVKARSLADESLHIASAFQAAGFPHVVGSLWPTRDDVCVHVAEHFYSFLFSNGGATASDRTVACAVRYAVRKVRSQMLSEGLKVDHRAWAGYVHLGA